MSHAGRKQLPSSSPSHPPTGLMASLLEDAATLVSLVGPEHAGTVLLVRSDHCWGGFEARPVTRQDDATATAGPAVAASLPASDECLLRLAAESARSGLAGRPADAAVLLLPRDSASDAAPPPHRLALIQLAGDRPRLCRCEVDPAAGSATVVPGPVDVQLLIPDLLPPIGVQIPLAPAGGLNLAGIAAWLAGMGLPVPPHNQERVGLAAAADAVWHGAGGWQDEGGRRRGVMFVESDGTRLLHAELGSEDSELALFEDRQSLLASFPQFSGVLATVAGQVPGGSAPPVNPVLGDRQWVVALRPIELPPLPAPGPYRELLRLGRSGGEEGDKRRVEAAVTAALQQAGAEVLRSDPDANCLVVRVGDGGEFPVFLGNILGECRFAPPAERPSLVAEFAGDVVDTFGRPAPQTLGEAGPLLRVQVVPRWDWQVAEWEASGGVTGPSGQVAYGPFRGVDHLAVRIVVDRPRAIAHVQYQQLAEWGLTYEQACAIALRNLRTSAGEEVADAFERQASGLYASRRPDHYNAPRILLSDYVRRLSVRGEHVVAAPHPQVLLVCGCGDGPALLDMASRMAALFDHPRFIGGIPLIAAGEGWQPYLPAEGSAAYNASRELRLRTRAWEYGRQAGPLHRRLLARGDDAFVSSLLLADRGGCMDSVAVWNAQVVNALPKADTLVFVEGRSPDAVNLHGAAPWRRVASLLGHLLEPMGDVYPPRFRTVAFPSRAQLRRLDLIDAAEFTRRNPGR
jgi:hypothetical protein